MRAEPALDAVTIEILWTRIVSIVDEAAKVIARTAFSTLSNEANDFACVLTDAAGRSLAQNTYGIPSFIATLPATVRHTLAEFGAETMRPGDVYITNNPWQGTGHLPDVCLVKPIFHDGQLVAFSATTSHVPDIGGNVRSVAPRELFEEGLHIPLTRFMRDGIADPLLLRIITANVRTPAQTIGDIWAQISANEMMEQRLTGMLREYRPGRSVGAGGGDFPALRGGDAPRHQRAAGRRLPLRHRIRRDGRAVPLPRGAACRRTGKSSPTTPAPRRSSRARSTAR